MYQYMVYTLIMKNVIRYLCAILFWQTTILQCHIYECLVCSSQLSKFYNGIAKIIPMILLCSNDFVKFSCHSCVRCSDDVCIRVSVLLVSFVYPRLSFR